MDFNKRSGICITIPPVFKSFSLAAWLVPLQMLVIHLNQKWGITLRLIPDR